MSSGNKEKSFIVHRELVDRALKSHKEHISKTQYDITFSGYVNLMIRRHLDREEVIKEYFPNFRALGIDGDDLNILDSKTNSLFQVRRTSNSKLRCVQDNTEICQHVMFALASVSITILL